MTRPFNPHGNRTADGVLIVVGLRVLDNNLDTGTVVEDQHDGDTGRERQHWYKVELDHSPAAPSYSRNRSGGYAVMNGERLTTVDPVTHRACPPALPDSCATCGWRYDDDTLEQARRGLTTLDANPTHLCGSDSELSQPTLRVDADGRLIRGT